MAGGNIDQAGATTGAPAGVLGRESGTATHVLNIAICSYGAAPFLERAIASALAQQPGDGTRILVVLNGELSPEGERLTQLYAGHDTVEVIHLEQPGLSHARNYALRMTDAPYLAFLDDDAVAVPGWQKAIWEALAAFPGAGMVCGPVDPEFETPRPAWLGDDLLGYYSAADWGGELRVLGPEGWPVGANMVVQVAGALAADGFDEKLGRSPGNLLSGEETELRNRLEARGLATIWQPQARALHRIPAARLTHDWLRRRVLAQAWSDHIADPAPDAASIEHLCIALKNMFPAWLRFALPLRYLVGDATDAKSTARQVFGLNALVRYCLAGETVSKSEAGKRVTREIRVAGHKSGGNSGR